MYKILNYYNLLNDLRHGPDKSIASFKSKTSLIFALGFPFKYI